LISSTEAAAQGEIRIEPGVGNGNGGAEGVEGVEPGEIKTLIRQDMGHRDKDTTIEKDADPVLDFMRVADMLKELKTQVPARR
jgi:hypothetical protein